MLTEKDKSRHILHTPQILYPDYEKVTYVDCDDVFQPVAPHLNARIYFLSDASLKENYDSIRIGSYTNSKSSNEDLKLRMLFFFV